VDRALDTHSTAGYRITEFSPRNKDALRDVAARLAPCQDIILDNWVAHQCDSWQPPGLTRGELREVFGRILRDMLHCLGCREPAASLAALEDTGLELALRRFPFQAITISVHFLEKSYLPYLLDPPSDDMQSWLLAMDEFLHAALASMSTSYFEAFRRELLQEVEVGRIVQEGLLATIPRTVFDLEVAHVYMSARERARLGGDFLDFARISQGRVAFIIGDLSGHGLEAAADSVMLRSLFRGLMFEDPNLPRTMERVNRILACELRHDQFATALAMSYDINGKLKLVSAGHPRPIVFDGECKVIKIQGTALSIEPSATYEVVEIDLEPGSILVAYTDGLVESRHHKEHFGEDRIFDAIRLMHKSSARDLADYLIDASLRHCGGRFADDVAMLVIKRWEE